MDKVIAWGLSAVFCLLELIGAWFVGNAFLERKTFVRFNVLRFIGFWGLCLIFARLELGEMLKIVGVCGLYYLSARYLFRGERYQVAVLVLLYCLFCGAITGVIVYSVCTFTGLSFSAFVWRKGLYTISVVIAKLAPVLLAWMLWRFRRKEDRQLSYKWLLAVILFLLVALAALLVAIQLSQENFEQSIENFIFCVVVVTAIVAVLGLICFIQRWEEEDRRRALMQQRMELQTESIRALEMSYREQRRVTHEFEHHLQTLQGLIEQGKGQVAAEYLEQLQRSRWLKNSAVHSHHPIMDAILNRTYQRASELGIKFQVQVNDLSEVSVQAEYLVVIMTNLLDNAIEACQRLHGIKEVTRDVDESGGQINCSVLADGGLFISIRNTSEPVTVIDGQIRTSKADGDKHGFGLPGVVYVLKLLKAEYTFGYENGWFQFVAEIPECGECKKV